MGRGGMVGRSKLLVSAIDTVITLHTYWDATNSLLPSIGCLNSGTQIWWPSQCWSFPKKVLWATAVAFKTLLVTICAWHWIEKHCLSDLLYDWKTHVGFQNILYRWRLLGEKIGLYVQRAWKKMVICTSFSQDSGLVILLKWHWLHLLMISGGLIMGECIHPGPSWSFSDLWQHQS